MKILQHGAEPVVENITMYGHCRNCGCEFEFMRSEGERIVGGSFNMATLIRCPDCRTKQYGYKSLEDARIKSLSVKDLV